jgi:hypothetical protein
MGLRRLRQLEMHHRERMAMIERMVVDDGTRRWAGPGGGMGIRRAPSRPVLASW